MKNPKYVISYPNSKKLSFGGHTMSPWTGYSLELIQTENGFISADKFRGYQDDVVNLSYTPSADSNFYGWNNVGGLLNGNTITFTDSNIRVSGLFLHNGSYTATSAKYDFVSNDKAGFNNLIHDSHRTYSQGYLQVYQNSYDSPTVFSSHLPTGCFVSFRTLMKANSVPPSSIYINMLDGPDRHSELCEMKLDNTKIPIYTLGGKITYSSNVLSTDGDGNFWIPGSVTNGTKLHSFVCSSSNDYREGFITAYYDGVEMINASSDNFLDASPIVHYSVGMYQLTGTRVITSTGTSVGVSMVDTLSYYTPLTGSISSQMRIFSSFHDAENWAKGL